MGLIFLLIIAAVAVGFVASHHGRNPFLWGFSALVVISLAGSLVFELGVKTADTFEVASLVVAVAMGVAASRPAPLTPLSFGVPIRLRRADDSDATHEVAPYRANESQPGEYTLVLRELMFDLSEAGAPTRQVAYRSLDEVRFVGDWLRLRWKDEQGRDVRVTVRPVVREGAGAVSTEALAQRIERLRPAT
jgi:hypothetical protein